MEHDSKCQYNYDDDRSAADNIDIIFEDNHKNNMDERSDGNDIKSHKSEVFIPQMLNNTRGSAKCSRDH